MAKPLNLDTTYEELMEQKLAGIDDTLDKREGSSMVYNATAGNSVETVQMLVTLKNFIDTVFADTAPREYLIRRAAERGLKPEEATKAKLKGVFNKDVPLQSRFSLDDLNYTVIERIKEKEFILECETVGYIGNIYFGNLIPIEYIDGLQKAELTELLIPGEDEEETEVFRTRYFNSFASTAFGGNRADYKEKVLKMEGVGGVRVYRAWNGGGTVKLVIINSQFEKPNNTLVDKIQNEVDPIDQAGEGVGTAPIDHVVTVFAVNEEVINITLNLTYQSGWVWADVEVEVQKVIDDYFKELAEEWAAARTYEEDHQPVIIRVSQIETRILNVAGVIDIGNTQINGGTSNVELDKESIPKRGVVSG